MSALLFLRSDLCFSTIQIHVYFNMQWRSESWKSKEGINFTKGTGALQQGQFSIIFFSCCMHTSPTFLSSILSDVGKEPSFSPVQFFYCCRSAVVIENILLNKVHFSPFSLGMRWWKKKKFSHIHFSIILTFIREGLSTAGVPFEKVKLNFLSLFPHAMFLREDIIRLK